MKIKLGLGKGWHKESERHSRAKLYGSAPPYRNSELIPKKLFAKLQYEIPTTQDLTFSSPRLKDKIVMDENIIKRPPAGKFKKYKKILHKHSHFKKYKIGSKNGHPPTLGKTVSTNVEKFAMRENSLKYFKKKPVVLDLFGGEGQISQGIYKKKTSDITVVEVNRKRGEALKRKFGEKNVYRMNNMKFIEKILPTLNKQFNVVDFDATGSPAPQLKKFFEVYKPKHKMIVFITDGMPFQIMMNLSTNKIMKSLYGQGLNGKNFQQLANFPKDHFKFMNRLGRKYGFKAKRLYGFFGKGKHVYYASYEIIPSKYKETGGTPEEGLKYLFAKVEK